MSETKPVVLELPHFAAPGNEVLTLVSELVTKPDSPPQKVCGTCSWFTPSRNPDTGRVLWSRPGYCAWTIPKFDLPLSVIRGYGPALPMPHKVAVYKDTDARECKCWAS